VGDEVLAGLAPLVGVALAGEAERVLDRAAVEPAVVAVCAVLADDREQVAEEGALVGGQVPGDLVDRRRRPVAAVADPRMTAPVAGARRAAAGVQML
jgi:hypothetical protein